jgi:hypothetical protein
VRIAIGEMAEADELEGIERASCGRPAMDAAAAQAERGVVGDAQVREQRVRLEDHADVATLRGDTGDVASAEEHRAAVGGLEPREHAQRRRLAAPRGAEE